MRKAHASGYRRRKRSSHGCIGCFGKLLTFSIFIALFIVLGCRAFQASGLKAKILQTQYPLKYQSYVEASAKEFSLEKELIYAIIRTESKFDPYAESSAGAKGLMQLREETAQDCAKRLQFKRFSPDMLFEPEINIRLGCYYFSQLLKQYQGNLQLAIAAYNGGPGNVDKWLKNPQYTDEKGNLSYIPFLETQNYVKRVNDAREKITPTRR